MPAFEPLIVPGELESLKTVRDFVVDASARAGLNKVMANRLRLAVDEIVTNSIVHGYGEAGLQGDIWLEGHLDDTRLTIIVEDEGAYYDPTQHDMPTTDELGEALETREIGGLGIYLAVNAIDEFRFERVGPRNRNIFIVYRPSSG